MGPTYTLMAGQVTRKMEGNEFYLANNFWLCSQQKVQDMMCINWALKSWLQDLTKIDKMQMKSFLFPSKSRPRHGKKIGNWHVIYVYVLTILKIEKKKRLHMVWPCLAVQDKEKGEGNNKFSLHFLTLAKKNSTKTTCIVHGFGKTT